MGYTSIGPTTLLSPLPVVMVSCCDGDGRNNIVTAVWCGIVNTHPPMLSVSLKPSRLSHDWIRERGAFVVSLVDRSMAEDCDFCGVRSGRDTDKFRARALTPLPLSALPEVPGIQGSPVCLPCRVHSIQPLGSHDLILGNILDVCVRDDLFDGDGSLHLERAGLVAYNHGVYQCLGDVIGFFGYSVARKDVRRKRMQRYAKPGGASGHRQA